MKPAKFISTAVLSAAAVSALGSVPAEAAITPNPEILRTDRAHHGAGDVAREIDRQAQAGRQSASEQAESKPARTKPARTKPARTKLTGTKPAKARKTQGKAARSRLAQAAPQQSQAERQPATESPTAERRSQAQSPNVNRQSRKTRESGIESLNVNTQAQRAGQAKVREQKAAQQPTTPDRPQSESPNTARQEPAAQRDAAGRSRRLARMPVRLNKCLADAFTRLHAADSSLRQPSGPGSSTFGRQPGTRGRVSTLPAVQDAGSARQSDDSARPCRMG